jgi:probable HAF family extracellular repeat protein
MNLSSSAKHAAQRCISAIARHYTTPLFVPAVLAVTLAVAVPGLAQESSDTKPQRYRVVVLPVGAAADSYLGGYLFFGPLNHRGTIAYVTYDPSNPGVYEPYTWTDGRKTDLQTLPSIPDWSSSGAYMNWINQWGLSAGYATRTDPTSNISVDNAVVWTPDGTLIDILSSTKTASHAVWVNDIGQVSGWTASTTPDPCSFGTSLANTKAVMWEFGVLRKLGTLGGTDSYGEFINDRGQISGHSQTSDTPNTDTGCPPFDPFIWQDGKMTDINPGNFGGAQGGTNFLDNRGQAVGFGTLKGETAAHPFLWQHGKLEDLSEVGTAGGTESSAFNVNEFGHVVGISYTAGNAAVHAVLWRGKEFIDLSTLSGDDCSEPFRINNRGQIVGTSFSCETGVEHAFLWERGHMVDLNSRIPTDSGLQLEEGQWINDDGMIAAQAVLTSGPDQGASRAVLLIPDGDYGDDAVGAAAAAIVIAEAAPESTARTAVAALQGPGGRANEALLKPFSPALFGAQKLAH